MRRTVGKVVVDFAELSDAGRDPAKSVNEDSCAYAETPHGHLVVVCDGMGGHTHGQEASKAAIRSIIEMARALPPGTKPEDVLRASIEKAAMDVFEVGGQAPTEARPGTTCVALLIHDEGADVAHVGDSRSYLIRDGDIVRLTRDHSMVQDMIDAGVLTEEEAWDHPDANRITRALGMSPSVEVEQRSMPLPLRPGDALLLCSDGLTDLASDDEIRGVIEMNLPSGPHVPCERLVNLANVRGGYDNVTVQLVQVVDAPPMLEPPEPMPTVVDAGATVSPDDAVPMTKHDPRVGGGPAPTVVDEGEPPERRRARTVPQGPADALALDSAPAAAGPTVVDSADGPRTDPVGPAVIADQPAATAPAAPKASSGRWFVALGAGIAVMIVVGVLVWALVGSDSEPSAAEPSLPPPPPPAGFTPAPVELVPDAEIPPPAPTEPPAASAEVQNPPVEESP